MNIDPNAGVFPSSSFEPTGLTIRAHIAGLALQGLLANEEFLASLQRLKDDRRTNSICELAAFNAVEFADALIKELNKGQS